MLLLHISDIHFRHGVCNTPMDPDLPHRTVLIQDARALFNRLGPADGILVGGDIAFRGMAEEYDAAFVWLSELADACGCSLERIFVVPGNHDVDRRIVTENASVRNVQAAIASAANPERELRDQFNDADAGRSLLASIGAYNTFAARFNCQVYAPERLFWQQDLFLDDHTMLRLYGLTSTLLSRVRGLDDAPRNLYLSPLQTVLNPLDGVVNLVMCHHPPDWFKDHDNVDDAICGRAGIHLFGHRHRQRLIRDPSYARFSAGAVNPDRNEAGWEPGYNIIQLSTTESNGTRLLDIQAHLRVWQASPDMFRARMASPTDDVFRYQIPIRGAQPTRRPMVSPVPVPVRTETSVVVADATDVEATMSGQRSRNLVLRFWDLASSARRDIALSLGLISAEEIQSPEPERYGRALRRAGERGQLEQLAAEIEKKERA